MNKRKQIALDGIILSMNKIKDNLQNSLSEEDVKIDCEAMLKLACAFEIIYKC